MRLNELTEQRAKAVAAMRALMDTAESEGRDLTDDEAKSFEEHKGAVKALDAKIERAKALDALDRGAPAIISKRGDGSYEERAADFSIMRAVAAQLSGSNVDDGFEREISAEVQKRSKRSFRGIAVPDEVFRVKREQRAPITIATEAADLQPNVHHPELYLDLLRDNLVAERLGATVLTVGPGTHDVPKAATGSQAFWLGEDDSITESTPTFTDVNLTPKTVGARTSWTRRAMINAVPDMEQLMRRDLAVTLANAIDIAAIVGDGTGNQPTGILNQSGVGTADMSTPTWGGVLGMVTDVEQANALRGSLGFAMNPETKRILMSTVRVSSTDSRFIMETTDRLVGFPVGVTAALPGDPGDSPSSGVLVFGDWSSLLIAYWTGVDILVNPFEATAFQKGRVLIRVMRDLDVQIRYSASFSYADNVGQ